MSLDGITETVTTVRQKYLDQRQFFAIAAHSMPVFLVVGNHENEEGWNLDDMGAEVAASLPVPGGNARKRCFANPVPDGFYTGNTDQLPEIDGDHLREDCYAFQWGSALFVTIRQRSVGPACQVGATPEPQGDSTPPGRPGRLLIPRVPVSAQRPSPHPGKITAGAAVGALFRGGNQDWLTLWVLEVPWLFSRPRGGRKRDWAAQQLILHSPMSFVRAECGAFAKSHMETQSQVESIHGTPGASSAQSALHFLAFLGTSKNKAPSSGQTSCLQPQSVGPFTAEYFALRLRGARTLLTPLAGGIDNTRLGFSRMDSPVDAKDCPG